jgi:hypothetical protein
MTMPGNAETAFEKAAWLILRWLCGILVGLAVTVWGAYFGELIYQSIQGQTTIEYTIQTDNLADFLPDNVAKVVKITSGKLDVTEGTLVTIAFWNRTVRNLDRTDVRVTTEDSGPVPFHKVLLYPPDSLDKDWVNWAKPDDNPADLDFSVNVLNTNWEPQPDISVRYFYAGRAPQQFAFKTDKPGVHFAPYDTAKTTWWLLGLDTPLEVTGFSILCAALLYAGHKFNKWFLTRQREAISRALWNSMTRNFQENDVGTPTRERFLWLSTWMFARSIKRRRFTRQTDPEIIIPREIGMPPSPSADKLTAPVKDKF